MGCDIHPHIEIRKDGEWHYFGVPINHRNYFLFGMLSGVRGDGNYCQAPHQIPEDSCREIVDEYESWGLDGHNLTIVYLDDLDEIYEKEIKHEVDEDTGEPIENRSNMWLNKWREMVKKLAEMTGDEGNVRIILWYDN